MLQTIPHRSQRWLFRMALCSCALILTVIGLLVGPQIAKTWKLQQSAKLLQDRRNVEAKELLQSLRTAYPQDPVTLLRLARVHRRLGEFESMSAILREAAKQKAPVKAIELETTLAKAQVGNVNEVVRDLSKLLVDPGDDGPDICEAYANGYFLLNKIDFAFRIIEAWKADFPRDPQPYLFAGVYFEQIGISSKSIPALRRALELAPHRTEIRVRLAKQLCDTQEAEQSMVEANAVLRADPTNEAAKVIRAKCLNVSGKSADAIQVLEEVLSTNPQYVDALVALGQLLIETRQFESAVRSLTRAVELRPFDSGIRYAFANALVGAGAQDEAKRHFQIVSEAKQQLAMVNQLKDSVSKTPNSADLRYEIGWRLLKFDDPSQGEMWLRGALEVAPDHEKSRAALIEYYKSTGKTDLVRLYSANQKSQD